LKPEINKLKFLNENRVTEYQSMKNKM